MENCVSKEAIEIIKMVYQALLLAKERLAHVVYGREDQWGEDNLKRTLDDIVEYCKKYPWLRELGRGYMYIGIYKIYVAKVQNDHFSFLVDLEQT